MALAAYSLRLEQSMQKSTFLYFKKRLLPQIRDWKCQSDWIFQQDSAPWHMLIRSNRGVLKT